ncbi:MAG: hypothetical protein HN570_06810 [Verrucomicrobia bacterium]|jgi:hypothetical protein|nr:hypothetical protein [Verrucomicrobiota bacterium]MDA7658772.1 hypothetical protein [Akkermansiaceae bacterium]MDB4535522.1 hypothetical protein [bacterium]MBT7970692.1 hypothetical protein [Verrucomicrobiota bacterium]MDA7663407.1 hypothetical protein [Akkermansiaceae bacterium]
MKRKKVKYKRSPTKREDLELLMMMALADGELSAGEWNLLVKFPERMGLSVLGLRNIIRGIKSDELITL